MWAFIEAPLRDDVGASAFPRSENPLCEEPPLADGALPRAGLDLAGERSPAPGAPTLLLDWDRERYAGAVPRRIPMPSGEEGPAWLAFPHQRYVLCVRHRRGRVEHVYVTSLVGKRDSLVPAGDVERVVTDDRSVTIVVDGRPILYAVESGATVDLVGRRILGTTAAGQ